MIYDTVDEVISERFESLLSKFDWRFDIKISVKGSNFIFNRVNVLYYKCH